MAGPVGPIESKYQEGMNKLGAFIDKYLNGEERPRKTGFALMIFDFGPDERMNYLSNASREDMIAALKELVATLEGRAVDQEGHA